MGRAVFLDKDGTILQDIPYNVDVAKMQFTPGAERGLRRLFHLGFRLLVVTNQSGVARGYFDERALADVEQHLRDMFARSGVPLHAFYYCPHHPAGVIAKYALSCACRKPAPGLLLRAAREHNLDLARSWFIGDILDDVEAGRRAGCKTILVDNGSETEWRLSALRTPHYRAANLAQAAEIIQAELENARVAISNAAQRVRV